MNKQIKRLKNKGRDKVTERVHVSGQPTSQPTKVKNSTVYVERHQYQSLVG
eukprot:m.199251 g.199251  ORF g.199251 m.199251 type:complete len:51 (-) comp14936_c0_seq1:2571-2723(-)